MHNRKRIKSSVMGREHTEAVAVSVRGKGRELKEDNHGAVGSNLRADFNFTWVLPHIS
jgi:hypothetical protein